MPRPKKYKNQEERRLAARLKSRRHYEKNSVAIKERKKASRLAYLKELEQQQVAERHERRRQRLLSREPQTEEQSQLQLRRDTSVYNSQYISLKSQLLNTILKREPHLFFEDLYQKLIAQLCLAEPVDNPLETARGTFQYRMGGRSVDQLWSEVWNDVGSGSLLDRFSALRDAFRSIEHALNDMEVALLEGNLLDTHERRRLMYQSPVFLKTFQELP
ncbi:hypothetical protein V5O48_005307 [Marasmius crinis-equi]|uniref:Uncharacterized protein n=1 Tax=Marasmius crinis-equi TaxID=585013 RepID=A0ABR3FNE0_9AGAR